MTEIKICLEQLINEGKDLSPVCKGQCSIYINAQKQRYCALSKLPNINCRDLYNFTFFKNACLFEKNIEGYN